MPFNKENAAIHGSKGGKITKPPEDVRSKNIRIAVTQVELDMIDKEAQNYELSRTEFLVRTVKRFKPDIMPEELANEVEKILELIAEDFKKLGFDAYKYCYYDYKKGSQIGITFKSSGLSFRKLYEHHALYELPNCFCINRPQFNSGDCSVHYKYEPYTLDVNILSAMAELKVWSDTMLREKTRENLEMVNTFLI